MTSHMKRSSRVGIGRGEDVVEVQVFLALMHARAPCSVGGGRAGLDAALERREVARR